ncbi:DUF5666 domain-containing protein [Paenarthrobacter nitroguajacolicus]|uniref:DUF5666 domain-containing protein n=1 Tax=Paenarthrobacter nitroguajacolicus TaxID=211146 RepID=UPI00248C7EAE|nr:DUF5666 domain-containing protein [Paenarthrobacter nitroguajacolicus]MDI2036191.1 hypothetical protein [Paenarthrobacter nitroguajacolicus]
MATLEPGLRKALLAGGIAVALTGAGGAAVWAGTQPSPSPSNTSATPSPSASAKAGANADRGQAIHGEHVVKQPDGSYRTVLTQSGSIESVNGSDVTVKSEDGFSQRYVINADTRIAKIPEDMSQLRNGSGSGKPALPSATAADLKTGDKVHISGIKDGSTVTATRIVAGELPAGLKGGHVLMGGHRGHGPRQATELRS